MVALHWSMAQICLGAIEVSASNSCERIVSILMLLLGFLSSSVIAATFSSALINWSLSLSEDNKQTRRLRQYFKQMEVKPEIAVRLTDEVRRWRCVRQMLSQDDVPALTMLSVSSQSELHFTICGPYMSLHSGRLPTKPRFTTSVMRLVLSSSLQLETTSSGHLRLARAPTSS